MFTGRTEVNETAVIGEDLTLQCNGSVTRKDSLQWLLYRSGRIRLRFCYRGEIKPDLTGKYILEPAAYGYNLIIRDIRAADAGIYVCTRSITEKITFLVDVINGSTAQPRTPNNIAGCYCCCYYIFQV